MKPGQTGLSGFVGTDGSQRHRRASMRCSSSGLAASGWWRGVNHDKFYFALKLSKPDVSECQTE
jgi:hypothetical protein